MDLHHEKSVIHNPDRAENDAAENKQCPRVPFADETLFRIAKWIFDNFTTIHSAHLLITKILFTLGYSYIKTYIKTAGRRIIIKKGFLKGVSILHGTVSHEN